MIPRNSAFLGAAFLLASALLVTSEVESKAGAVVLPKGPACQPAPSDAELGPYLGEFGRANMEGRFGEAWRALQRGKERVRARYGAQSGAFALTLRLEANLSYRLRPLPEVLKLYDVALAGARQCFGDASRQTLRVRSERARMLINVGQLEQGLAESREIARLSRATFGEDDREADVATGNFAVALENSGRIQEAEEILRAKVEKLARKPALPSADEATDLVNYAFTLSRLGRFEDAERYFALASQAIGLEWCRNRIILADTTASAYWASPTQTAQATLAKYLIASNRPRNLLKLGRHVEALAQSKCLMPLSESEFGTLNPARAMAWWSHADILLEVGQAATALPLYRNAYERLAQILGADHPDTRAVGAALANCLIQLNQPVEAAQIAEKVVRSDTRAHARIAFSGFGDQTFARELNEGTQRTTLLPDAIWAQSGARADEADRRRVFAALQPAAFGEVSRATARAALRRYGDTATRLGSMVERRLALSDQWNALEQSQGQLPGAERTTLPIGATVDRRMKAIDAELAQIDRKLSDEFPAYRGFVRPEAIEADRVQSGLRPGEAALLIVPSARGTHLVLVTPEEIRWQRVALTTDALAAAVSHLRKGLDCGSHCGPFDRRAAHDLYLQLFGPLAPAMVRTNQLFVVSAGPIASLPLGVLVTAPPSGRDEDSIALRNTAWLADAYAVVQLPSFESLAARRAGRGQIPADRREYATAFAGFGDPELGLASMEERSAPGAFDAPVRTETGRPLAKPGAINARFGAIHHTAIELEALRRAFNAEEKAVRIGRSARESAVRSADLSTVRVLAFATHGTLSNTLGLGEPGLIFTPPETPTEADDGVLVASEIAGLRLSADWVILSACNTAASRGEGAAAFSGLARAFFHAGARSLLVSHWAVLDAVAAQLTVRTVSLQVREPGLSRAQALQMAMREVRNDAAHPGWAHPSAWAPFALVGDAR